MRQGIDCEVCRRYVKRGEGVRIHTEGLEKNEGGTVMHQWCFDEVWQNHTEKEFVKIEVSGGIAEVTEHSDNVEIELIDHDTNEGNW